MTLWQAILMGFIQGLTEFLPVSSSGHLAIFQNIFHIELENSVLFDIVLHLGTLVAIFIVYWKDIWKLILEGLSLIGDIFAIFFIWVRGVFSGGSDDASGSSSGSSRRASSDGSSGTPSRKYRRIVNSSYRKFVVLIIVSTIFTGVLGLLLRDIVEVATGNLIVVGAWLIVTAVLLFVSDRLPDGWKTPKKTNYLDATIIGVAQGIATMPGLSRSGTTITFALLRGLRRDYAVKYSFILSIPAILGAAVLEISDIDTSAITSSLLVNYLVGMVVAAIIGYICIRLMLVIVRKKKFTWFAIYCGVVGLVAIVGGIVLL